jgi:hypothetical protein
MEAVRCRRGRENNKSPERIIRSLNHHQHDEELEEEVKTKKPIFRRVQVVYYLTRNGHLEHPHFIEVISPVNQPLRLRGKRPNNRKREITIRYLYIVHGSCSV